MKVKALKSFEGIRDLERSKKENKNVFPKEGDIWEVSEERANFLLEHGVVEIVPEIKEETIKPLEEVPKEDALSNKEVKQYKSNKKRKK